MYSDLLKVISEHAKMSFRRIYCSKKNTKKLKEIVSLFFFFVQQSLMNIRYPYLKGP